MAERLNGRAWRCIKEQSAMEYLMTYGWSILIIAIVVSVLYVLGAFNPRGGAGSCMPIPGFSCAGGTLNSAGAMTLTFGYSGQSAGQSSKMNITAIGCSNTSAAPATSWSWSAVSSSPLLPNQNESIIAACNMQGSGSLGSEFTGTVWIQYYAGSQGMQEEEIGTVRYPITNVARLPTGVQFNAPSGQAPSGLAYNPANGDMYVTDDGSPPAGNAISLISGKATVSTITFQTPPYAVAYDPSDGYMYVSNWGLATVNVISGSTILGPPIPVGANPYAIAYNPANGYMYVSNYGSATVTVISGTAIVGGPIPVGNSPQGIAYDPSDGYMYVANFGSGTVSVISGTMLVNTITVGSGPADVAFNPGNGDMYVTNWVSDTVNVISGTAITGAPISVGTNPFGIAYDPNNGYMYVANRGSDTVSIISGFQTVGNPIAVQIAPIAVAFNPGNGDMYVTNLDSGTVSII